MSEINHKISICAIYKNEEKNLETFIKRHIDQADEMIMVDTGSTDRSNEITRDYGIKYHFFEWVNDFSKARNYSLSKATMPYIIVLDIDEQVTPEDFQRLKRTLEKSEVDVYSLQQINFVNTREDTNWKSIKTLPSTFHGVAEGYIPSPLFRVFRNHLGVCFNGMIHELVGDSVARLKLASRVTDIPIYHYGWIEAGRTSTEKEQKEKAYADMIKTAWETDHSPKMAFYYLKTLKSPEEKIKLCYRLIKEFPEVKQFWEIMASSTASLKQWQRALSYVEKGLQLHPNNPSLLAIGVRCLNETAQPVQALNILTPLLAEDPWNPIYWFEKFRSLMLLGRKEEARELSRAFPEGFPPDLAEELRGMLN